MIRNVKTNSFFSLTCSWNSDSKPLHIKEQLKEEGFLARHKSAEKRSKQNVKARERNASIKSSIKTKIKSVLEAVEEKDKTASETALKVAIPAIGKASAKGVFHKKNASRKISRLTKKVQSLQS
jgi:small subunit ribosomal protein S20